MLAFILRRIVLIPIVLVLVNFIGFAFAHTTAQLQRSQTVYGSGMDELVPFLPEYQQYAQKAIRGDFGDMPVGLNETIVERIVKASGASLGLMILAFLLSVAIGLALGLAAVRVNPPRTMPWLTVLSTVGLAMPSFYLGTLLISLLLLLALRSGSDPLLPVGGFGWDIHLLLPVLALSVRPVMQTAQVVSSLLAGELEKRYVVAARSFGYTWRDIRWNKALRNVLAPVVVTFAGSFRLLAAELILVEWLFNWPGLGRLLVQTLVPPSIAGPGGFHDETIFFLNAPLVAALLVVFAALFLLADLLASTIARAADPRLRVAEEAFHE